MFLGCKCCDEPCNTAARSGGAGITINRYAMPDYGGTVEFYYNAQRVPDRFTIYNTNSEDEIYFDTGERVSGSKTIKFYKPKGVRSVSVKVDGPSGTAWEYRIGCPELSCLVTNCHSDIDPPPILDSITLTLDVPSYKLRIPRIGAEYWYHYRESFGPQSGTYSVGDLGQQTFTNPFNPNGEYVDKIPVVLPLDFKAPQLHRDEWIDGFGRRNWTWSQSPTERGISQGSFGTRVIPPEEYVRPDQFLKGWYKNAIQFADDGDIFEEPIGYSAGEWEYVGKIEFEGYWELDGDAYSGTYELQKVQKENGEYVYVYYFDEGEPYCNGEAINDTARLYCGGSQGAGLGYAKSFILVDGCSIHLSNLKVKFRYGLTDNDPSCQPIYDMDNFVFNGYATIDGSQSAGNTIGIFPVTPIDITPEGQGLESNSSIPLGCSYGIALRRCASGYENGWSPSVGAWGHGYKTGVPEADSSNTNNAVVSSNSLYKANNQQDQEDDVCYGDLGRLLALREVCTYSKEFVDDECNPTCAAIITPYNGLSALMYSYDEQVAKPVTLEAAVSIGDIATRETNLGFNFFRFRDGYFRQLFETGSRLNQLEFNLYSTTNYGPSQFVIEDFFGGGHYWSGFPTLVNFNPTKESTSFYAFFKRGIELALPWLPTWIQTYIYDRQGDLPWQKIAPYDPYYEETGYAWYDRCSLQSSYNSPPMGPNEWLCGKCATQWYVDQGLWIEEWPSRRFAEILVTEITPHLSNQ